MIEKVIENWLIKASEKSYQLPFCYLLMQEGKTILHMTRHSAMEHGKDITALDETGRAHAYQLKGINGGRLSISGWQEIQQQVMQMVLTPCTHPSIRSNEYHESYLVVNGDIEEEVQHAIAAINHDWDKKGFPQYRINTIVKGQILDMAFKAKESFLPTEIIDFKTLLEFQLEDGIGFLDKGKFSRMLVHLFEEKQERSNAESRRVISSAALLCSLASASYTKAENHIAIVEAWSIYLLSVFRTIEKNNLNPKEYANEIEIAQTIITNTLKDLFEEIKDKEELLYGDLLTDAFVFKQRITILVGYVAFLGLIADTDQEMINTFLDKHLPESELWGESCIPFLLTVYFFYLHSGQTDKANEFIMGSFQRMMHAIITPGILFPDIYTDVEKALAMRFEQPKDDNDLPTPRVSYILEPLISVLSQPQFREFMTAQWPEISRCVFSEQELDELFDFYLWRIPTGQHINRYPKSPQSWQELLHEGTTYNTVAIPRLVQSFSKWLPLFLMVFPHRLSSNLIRWFLNSRGN